MHSFRGCHRLVLMCVCVGVCVPKFTVLSAMSGRDSKSVQSSSAIPKVTQFIIFFWVHSNLAASGPVRLFTPYKRRRRNQINMDNSNIQIKLKKQSEEESENDQGIVTKEETTWQTITDGIDGTGEYIDSSQSTCFHCLFFFFYSFSSISVYLSGFSSLWSSACGSQHTIGSFKDNMCPNDQSNK